MNFFVSLFLLSLSFSMSAARAHDCGNFSQEVAGLDQLQKVEYAKVCKEKLIDLLESEIKQLDKSTFDCSERIAQVKEVIQRAKGFTKAASLELVIEQPDQRVEAQMQRSMSDLIYALSERIESRDCSHFEYIETKADAQVEVLLLQDASL